MMTGHLSRRWAAVAVLVMFAMTLGVVAAPASAQAEQERFEHWLNVSDKWHTGAINHVNSDYVEGDVVPHRIVFENREVGSTYTFGFSYEYEDTKIRAYGHDFVTYVNATESPDLPTALADFGVFKSDGLSVKSVSTPSDYIHGDRIDRYHVVEVEFTAETAYFYYGAHLALPSGTHLGASAWHGGNLENRFDRDGVIGPRGDRTLSMKVGLSEPEPDKGVIVVKKEVPGVSSEEFEFQVSYGDNFYLADGQSNESVPLDRGTYTVEELQSQLGDGWFFDGVTCSSSAEPTESGWTPGESGVTIDLVPPERVTCVFQNYQEIPEGKGRVVIVKTAPQSSTEAFGFAPSYGSGFTLMDSSPPHDSGPLDAGTYTIAEELSSGQVSDGWYLADIDCETNPTDAASTWSEADTAVKVTLVEGEVVTCTFENRKRGGGNGGNGGNGGDREGAIGDFVWFDTNGNGVQDSGELPLEGVTVQLLDAPGKLILESMKTDSAGKYLFTGLDKGTYRVKFLLPDVYDNQTESFTKWSVGPVDKDSDADPTSAGMTAVVALSEGETDLTWDAGVIAAAVLGAEVQATTSTVAVLAAETLPFTGAGVVGLGMLGLMVTALGGLVLATTRAGRHS